LFLDFSQDTYIIGFLKNKRINLWKLLGTEIHA
jgi:hypothetical protein